VPSAGGGRAAFYGGKWYRSGGNQTVSVSANNGTTFTSPTSSTLSRANDIAVRADGRILVAYESLTINYSDDEGATWTEGATLLSLGFPAGVIRMRILSSGTIVALCTAGVPADNTLRIAVSRNGGESFTTSSYRFPTGGASAVEVCEWGDGYVSAVNSEGEVANSFDDGITWTNGGLSFPTLARGASGDNVKLLVCGNGGQLWSTTDGATWVPVSTAYGEADILWVSQVP